MTQYSVAIAGLGTIGLAVARRLDAGVGGLTLTAVSARDLSRAAERVTGFSCAPKVLPAPDLAPHADIVVECVPADAFRTVAEPALEAGRSLVTVSGGALLDHTDLIDLAERKRAQIVLATGALLGLDAVRAAAEGAITRAAIVTRKPPASLAGAPYLKTLDLDLAALSKPVKVFDGSAREGARGFPANVNVAAALALAGIGPDATQLQVWADPALTRNTHTVEVEADSARLVMTIENVPSEDNRRTGRITALSVIAALRRLTSPLVAGS